MRNVKVFNYCTETAGTTEVLPGLSSVNSRKLLVLDALFELYSNQKPQPYGP
jgi:hypothetical protein